MTKTTQVQKIIDFMQKHDGITTMDAFGMGITRLASRIHEIRRMGIEIDSRTETAKNRDGETVHFSRYRIA